MLKSPRGLALLFLLCHAVAAPALLQAQHARQKITPEALEIAMRFATAIVSDEVDRGRAQESVVQDLAEGGFLDDAARQARGIEGWRRGTALADLAARQARLGRTEQARALIDEAGRVQGGTRGWQQRRIEMHVLAARAGLAAREPRGEADEVSLRAAALAKEDSQYAGRPEAIAACVLSEQGELDRALMLLSSLDGAQDIDASLTRTEGYLAVAGARSLDAARRLEVLARAERSANGIPGWPRLESLARVARLQSEAGDFEAARRTLRGAQPLLESLPPTLPAQAMARSRAAASWAAAGDASTGLSLLRRAENAVPAMSVVGQPGAYAAVAGGFAVVGDRAEAARLFEKSLDAAAGLANARPRALAVVEIAREMARAGWTIDAATGGRFETLFRGLRDPW